MFRVWEIWPLEIRVPCVQASLTKSGESFSILIDYSFFDVDIFESSDWFEEFDCYDIFYKDFAHASVKGNLKYALPFWKTFCL